MKDLRFLTARPIAHRGLHDLSRGIVENCTSAFAAAIAGAFAIECDVQVSADGAAMVFHDYVLERLTTGEGRVDRQSAADLQTIAFKATADRMQTLPDLLTQVAGQVPLVIEIKSRFDGDLRLVRRVIADVADYQGPLAVMSFDPGLIAVVKREAPHLVRGLVAESRYDDAYWQHLPPSVRDELERFVHASETDPDFLSWRVADLPAPATVLFRALLRRPVICWTVRSASDRALAARHADQVTFEGYRP